MEKVKRSRTSNLLECVYAGEETFHRIGEETLQTQRP